MSRVPPAAKVAARRRAEESEASQPPPAVRPTLDYRCHNFLPVRSNYTWSKALDTSSLVTAQGTENDVPQDPDSLAADYGRS